MVSKHFSYLGGHYPGFREATIPDIHIETIISLNFLYLYLNCELKPHIPDMKKNMVEVGVKCS